MHNIVASGNTCYHLDAVGFFVLQRLLISLSLLNFPILSKAEQKTHLGSCYLLCLMQTYEIRWIYLLTDVRFDSVYTLQKCKKCPISDCYKVGNLTDLDGFQQN